MGGGFRGNGDSPETGPGGRGIPGKDKVRQVLQPAGTDGHVEGIGGHSDGGSVKTPRAGIGKPHNHHQAQRVSKGTGGRTGGTGGGREKPPGGTQGR